MTGHQTAVLVLFACIFAFVFYTTRDSECSFTGRLHNTFTRAAISFCSSLVSCMAILMLLVMARLLS